MQDFEKLGAFYLGKRYDLGKRRLLDELILYDAKDLRTHAVCVGMTGSGKTGLCVGLLEEAAIDGIPTIAIDPKGDIGNLLLTFPHLRPGDFEPWVDSGVAAQKGESVKGYASKMASLWKKGLADWGQDGSRIARFRDAVDLAIYTPGSQAGLPLAVLKNFAAPSEELARDDEALRERILSAVSGLLALLGIDADPIRSRECILLSNILDASWRAGRSLDLAGLIRQIQAPPFKKVGVFDLDSFFPAKDRFELSMALNNLLASPGFASWMTGEPLDIQRLLWTAEGKPRISVLSISHLSDSERMFFVTLLLNEVVSWMRSQAGTSALRALIYMDEVFGFFPPVANPPSKRPMLTLLKQARAYGVGCVLATQNPVDLDYKGLSNAGTWFLGRLQTERDKRRVLEGLEGASAQAGAEFDRDAMEKTLAGLGSRVFLMNNVHEDAPVTFHTRWALSYLRGPLTKSQIGDLMEERKATAQKDTEAAKPVLKRAEKRKIVSTAQKEGSRPLVQAGVEERFLAVADMLAEDETLVYRPAFFGAARLHYVNSRLNLDVWESVSLLAPAREDTVSEPWDTVETRRVGEIDLEKEGEEEARFNALPALATKPATYKSLGKRLANHCYRSCAVTLFSCSELKLTSTATETEGDFRARMRQVFREHRDLAVEKLRKKFKPKLARLEERIRKSRAKVEKEEEQYSQKKYQAALSLGATVLGAIFGRKLGSRGNIGRATTTARGVGRAARERGDIERAKEDLHEFREQLDEMERELHEQIEDLEYGTNPDEIELTEKAISPRKSDIAVAKVVLVWTPWRVSETGIAEPAYRWE